MEKGSFYSRVRDNYLQKLVELIKLPYIKLVHPNRKPWNVTMDNLKNYGPSTLGAKLYQFLRGNNLHIQSLYESHDIYHIISG